METEIQYGDKSLVKKDVELNLVDEKTLRDYLLGSNTKLTEQQQLLFLQTARAFNLNPFKREVYAYASGGNLTIVTGYEVYLKRAEDTGKLDGWKVELLTNSAGQVTGSKITIYRKDWKNPFEHSVSMGEYKLANALWNSKPITMIKKVAIGQGFRLCFPNDLGGMPYLPEELPSETKEPLPPENTHQAEPANPYPPVVKQDTEHGATPTIPSVEVHTVTINVDKVTRQDGKKNGKEWTKYLIHTIDNYFATFDKKLAEIAKESVKSFPLQINYTIDKYGKNLKSIEGMPEAKPVIPVEDVGF